MFGQQLQMLAGFPEHIDVRAPVPLSAATLPRARITPPKHLSNIALSSVRDRATRCYGRAYRDIVRGFAGDFRSAPDLVLRPRDEDDVRIAMDWAAKHGYALVPYGGGTSVVGGVEVADRDSFAGVVCLDMRSMDRVLEVDDVSRAARIQAGATGPRLEDQLRSRQLSLRFYPQSFELSTLGGWIATRAGGHFATLYTHIDDLVESTRMIAPSGLFESRRLPGSGAGPSPDRLVLGSEGALGVITDAWVRVRPRPVWRGTASVRYAAWNDAVAATRAVAQSGLNPSNCRLLDKREALLNRVATDGSHVLLLGFESPDRPVDEWLERTLELALDYGGTCRNGPSYRKALTSEEPTKPTSSGASDRWRKAFLEAPYLVNSMVSLGIIADTFETACTWDRLDALHSAVVHEVRDAMKRVCGKGMISCRFTHVYPDGPAPYFTLLAPAKRGSELSQWAEIKAAASEAVLSHGGTITHHHAVGRMHLPWYIHQRPEPWGAVLQAAKRTLDPAGILNPGVLI